MLHCYPGAASPRNAPTGVHISHYNLLSSFAPLDRAIGHGCAMRRWSRPFHDCVREVTTGSRWPIPTQRMTAYLTKKDDSALSEEPNLTEACRLEDGWMDGWMDATSGSRYTPGTGRIIYSCLLHCVNAICGKRLHINPDSAVERLRSRASTQTPAQDGKMMRAQGRGSCPRLRRGDRHLGIPDFLDARLKHTGMTRGTMVNCRILV
jgi:hypothetical protein